MEPVFGSVRTPFPVWQRRLDPFLEAAETNLPYQLFRMRRREHGGPRFLSFATYPLMSLFKWMATGVIFAAGLALAFFYSCFFLVLPLMTLPFIRFVSSGKRLSGASMPRSVGAVFSRHGYHEQAAIDLWMAGVSGRDVAEAIYMEQMGRARWFLMLAYVPLWTAVWLVYILRVGIEGYGPMMATIGLPFFAWHLFGTLYSVLMRRHGVVEMRERLNTWRGEMPNPGILLVDAILTLIALALLVAFAVFPAALLLSGPSQGAGTFAGFCFLLGGLGLAASKHYLHDFVLDHVQRHLAAADRAFAIFMGATVVRDDLGKAWALWAYAEDGTRSILQEPIIHTMHWADAAPEDIPDVLPTLPPLSDEDLNKPRSAE